MLYRLNSRVNRRRSETLPKTSICNLGTRVCDISAFANAACVSAAKIDLDTTFLRQFAN
jgi:hypothetical protein